MSTARDIDDVDVLRPASAASGRLYREAFARHGSVALFNRVQAGRPTVGDTLAVTEALRVEGDLAARSLAESLEREAVASVRDREGSSRGVD